MTPHPTSGEEMVQARSAESEQSGTREMRTECSANDAFKWPKALSVTRHADNSWHADISFARCPTDAEIKALGEFLRDHYDRVSLTQTQFIVQMILAYAKVYPGIFTTDAMYQAAATYREFIRSEGIEFGDPRYAWDASGAMDLVLDAEGIDRTAQLSKTASADGAVSLYESCLNHPEPPHP